MNYFLVTTTKLVVYYREIKTNLLYISCYRCPLNLKLNKYEMRLSLDKKTKTEWKTSDITPSIDQLKEYIISYKNYKRYKMYILTRLPPPSLTVYPLTSP